MKIACADLHIGSESTLESKVLQFFDLVEERKPECLICCGDSLELMLKSSFEEIKASQLFPRLLQLAERCKVYLVEGNHDPYSKLMEYQRRGELAGVTVVKDELVLDDIIFTHGDRFDPVLRFEDRFLGWFYRFLPYVWQRWLAPTPRELKRRAKKVEEYTVRVGSIHQRAWKYARERNCRAILLGHTHSSEHKKTPAIRTQALVHSAWDNEFIYSLVDDQGEVSLQTV